jgi:hypothetical protein
LLRETAIAAEARAGTTIARNACDASRKARERSNRNVDVTASEAGSQYANRFNFAYGPREPGTAFLPRDSRSSAEAGLKAWINQPSKQEK